MIKNVIVDVTALIPFPNSEISEPDLVKNKGLINHFSSILADIFDLNVISTDLALDRLLSLEQSSDPNINSMVLAGLGGIHTFVGNYINAFSAFRKSLDLVDNNEVLAIVYSELSTLLRKLEYKSEAIALIRGALGKTTNETLIWKLRTQLGLCYKYSEPEIARGYLFKSYKYYDSVNYYPRKARILRHLGSIYIYEKEYQKAIQYIDQALNTIDEFNLQTLKYDTLSDKGWVFICEGLYNKAVDIYRKLLLSNLTPYQRSLFTQNLGYMEYKRGNYKDAIKHHSHSLQITSKYEMRDMAFEDYYKLGLCHDKIGEIALADKYFATGYQDLQQEIELGLRILGYRKSLLNSYIEFLNRNKSIPEIDINTEAFGFTMHKTMKEIRAIFHTNLLQLHLDHTKNAPELCDLLEIEPRTYFIYQKKLGLKRGPGIPSGIENNPYFLRYIDSISDLNWRDANRQFEVDLFSHLLKEHRHNKKSISQVLQVSYQQVLMKTKGLN